MTTRQEMFEQEAREYAGTRLWPMYLAWLDVVAAMERAECEDSIEFVPSVACTRAGLQ